MKFRLIFKQLTQDLIGKDAFRGITLSYAWLANQFGHFALGFIPTAIIYTRVENKESGDKGIYWPSLLIWGIWLAYEVINFLYSILKKTFRIKQAKKEEKIFYKSRKWHFIRDTFTDLMYFALGGVAARLAFIPDRATKLLCIIIVIYLAFEFYYWYLSKIYLQRALYPFQFRISQWTKPLNKTNKEKIDRFMNSGSSNLHLLVFGEDDDEKIHLCVGIGSELSYQLMKCRYLTAIKAFECFYRKEPEDNKDSHYFSWNWHEAKLLIIDDINPSHADMAEVITTTEFLEKTNHKFGDENRKQLCEKKVIWMLGNENEGDTEQMAWKEMLVKIGVDHGNIITINLSEK